MDGMLETLMLDRPTGLPKQEHSTIREWNYTFLVSRQIGCLAQIQSEHAGALTP